MSDKSTIDVNVSPCKQFFIESLTRDWTCVNNVDTKSLTFDAAQAAS